MKRKICSLVSIFVFIFSFVACSCKKEEISRGSIEVAMVKAYLSKDINGPSTLVFPFNTIVSLTYFYESEKDKASEYFKEEYSRLHALFDRHHYYFDDNNNLINNLRVINESNGEEVLVDQDLIDILNEGIRFTKLSKGKFNIGVGNLSSLWDGYIENANLINNPLLDVPSQQEINQALACTPTYLNIEDIIVVNDDNNTVKINNLNGCDGLVSITLGALGKSYAAEKIAANEDIKNGNFLINAGQSTIKVLGENLARENGDWNVGITDSYLVYTSENKYASYLLKLSDPISVSTSSGDEKHYFYNDNYYHHIIDPISGYPNQNRLGITALSSNAMYADIITTSLMSMNMDETKEYLSLLKQNNIDVEVFIQDKIENGVKIYVTHKMKQLVSIRENEDYKSYLDSIVIEEFSYDS